MSSSFRRSDESCDGGDKIPNVLLVTVNSMPSTGNKADSGSEMSGPLYADEAVEWILRLPSTQRICVSG